jgi:hypothetical protein
MPSGRVGDRVKLLRGPYKDPPLAVAEGETCIFQDCTAVVTGWTDGRTSWPRALPVSERGRPSLVWTKHRRGLSGWSRRYAARADFGA